jgi:ribokinase
VSSGDEHWLPRISVEAVDATDAGDAFAAALCVALVENRPLAEAGTFANAAAAIATTKLGAQPSLPRREAITALMASKSRHA